MNNCFPSLHTSLSISVALISIHSGYRRLALVISTSAAIIVFSTIYLGIHWLVDVVAGMAGALAAVNITIVYVDGLTPVRLLIKQASDLLLRKLHKKGRLI